MKYIIIPIFWLIVNIILTFVFMYFCLISGIIDLIWYFKLSDETIEILETWTYLHRYNIFKKEWTKILLEGYNK